MNELKTDLQAMYNRAGVKDEGVMFLFTEGQITNERFLVYINDLLSSGEIADLYVTEDKDAIVNNVRPACKGAGIPDSKENCWNFFIQRVRKNLHMSICFSPVGEGFRSRARKFPAIVNCTVIDWFQPWPEEALLSVARKFTDQLELGDDETRDSVVRFMPFSFSKVNECSQLILEQERRYVYTTPKSFLELIKLFSSMLNKTRDQLLDQKEKYELGVVKLKETGEVVGKLEEELKTFMVEVEAKKVVADEQAAIVGKEKAKVQIENDKAEVEATNCAQIKVSVEAKMAGVQKDLDIALPLVAKAEEALQGLDVKELQMMKSFKTPPKAVETVFTCVLNLLAGVDPLVPVDKKKKLKTDNPWKSSLNLMANPGALIQTLSSYKEKIDSQQVHNQNFKAIRPALADEGFNPDAIRSKSSAAAGICDWVCNIVMYYDVVESVEPKRLAVAEAQE